MKKIELGIVSLFAGISLFANNLDYFVFKSPVIKIQKIEKYKEFNILYFNFKKTLKNGNIFSSCLINKVEKKKSSLKINIKKAKSNLIIDDKYDYYLFCMKPDDINSYIAKLKVINPLLIKDKKNNNELFLETSIYKIQSWNGLNNLKY